MAASQHPVPTWHFGHFTVHLAEHLGRGSFGTVYRATDNRNNTDVAAKELSRDVNSVAADKENENSQQVKQFPNHPNVIQILHTEQQANLIWIFMEFCPFGDLNKFCRMYGLQGNKLSIMKQVTDGLTFLHEKRIAHRDLKPANILLTTGPVAKITDFSLAKFLGPIAEGSAMNSDVGTWSFKAPEFWERLEGGELVYHRSVDVFALGLIFLAITQATQGEDLRPVIENTLDLMSESTIPIGLVMYNRYVHNIKATWLWERNLWNEVKICNLTLTRETTLQTPT